MLRTCFFLILFLHTCFLSAQETGTSGNRLTPREFSIPASPVFDVMGVTPSQINRTADIKDFKVDWSFKSWRLNPNLAIQSQPFWELFYNRKDLSKYQAASGLMRKLASVDLSVGSVQDENNDRRIGFAVKANLLRQRDPLMARELYEDIGERFRNERTELEEQLKNLRRQLDSTTIILDKPGLRAQIRSTEDQLLSLNSRRNAEINERAKIFMSEHWNATSLDVAFGRVYSYQTDADGSLKSLRLNRNTAYAGWINGSVGIGRRLLLSGLFRSSWYQEELDFLVRNNSTGDEVNQLAVADNTLLTMGMNLRYGGPYFTFFAEFLYERKGLRTPVDALSKVFEAPAGFQVVGNSVKWDVVQPNTVSFGGDWRLNRSVVLNYGMRCIFNNDWKFTGFIPVVSVACMMR
ncbi:MAG TPA: hypothetical protein PKE63_10915 [Lacibacter sp.]|nr:hypothetical protein [Lacibacter sp.]HMO88460.1 hypothetical protein [Lacibacter sp.]HMP87781.1 hypothetical protein [Lacibacter sp.]